MKKLLLSLLLLVPIVTGCANVDTMVTINDNKSAIVTSSLTYQGDLSDSNDPLAEKVIDTYKDFLDNTYSVTNAYGAKLSTITATKKIDNLKRRDVDLSSLGFKSNLASGRFVEIKKNFLITSFNVDSTYDLKSQTDKFLKNDDKTISNSGKNSKVLTPEYYHLYGDKEELNSTIDSNALIAENLDDSTKQLVDSSSKNVKETKKNENSNFESTFSIKVPTFASYNNADSINGNVYTWIIRNDSPTVIKFQYVQYSSWAIGFVILSGVFVLLLVARRILKRDSQKRSDNIDNIV